MDTLVISQHTWSTYTIAFAPVQSFKLFSLHDIWNPLYLLSALSVLFYMNLRPFNKARVFSLARTIFKSWMQEAVLRLNKYDLVEWPQLKSGGLQNIQLKTILI